MKKFIGFVFFLACFQYASISFADSFIDSESDVLGFLDSDEELIFDDEETEETEEDSFPSDDEEFIDLSLTAEIGSNGRVLVLIDSSNQESDYLEDLLNDAGWLNTITSNAADFQSELQSGSYSNFLLLSSAQNLSNQTLSALQDAVSLGAGFIDAGNPLQRQDALEPLLGIEFGGLVNTVEGLSLVNSELQVADTALLLTPENSLVAELDGATSVASFVPDVALASGSAPAITLNDFGDGRSVYVGVDLLEEANAIGDTNNIYARLLINALNYVSPDPALNFFDITVPVVLTVDNLGSETPGRLRLALPDSVEFVGALSSNRFSVIQFNESTNTVTQIFDLDEDETSELLLWLTPEEEVTLTAFVDSGEASEFLEEDSDSVELTIEEVVQDEVLTDLGIAGGFNAFICDDFTSRSSDAHAGLAAGGNITIDSYGVASRLSSRPDTLTLIAGGDLSYGNGMIFAGSAIAGGSIDDVNQSVVYGLEQGATLEGNADVPIDFDAQFASLRQFSTNLSQVPATGSVDYRYGGIYITGDCSSDIQVFNLDGAIVLNSNHINLSCVPSDSTILFNIDGLTAGFKNIGLSQLHRQAPQILYNFFEAETVQLTHVGIEGSVLAPLAHFDNPQGQINGSVVAKSWDGPMELHDFPFIGSFDSVIEVFDGDLDVPNDDPDSDITPPGIDDDTGVIEDPDLIDEETEFLDPNDDEETEFIDPNNGDDSEIVDPDLGDDSGVIDSPDQDVVLDGLGDAQSFNGFFHNSFTSQYSDSHGRIAAGGDVSLNGYGVASRLPSQPDNATLVVGGNLSYGQGKLFVGSAVVAGSADAVNQSVINGLENGASLESGASLPIDFTAAFDQLKLLSMTLSQATANGSVQYQYGGVYLTGDCVSDTQVFELSGATVLNSNHLVLNCVPYNATIIFNIDGQTAGFKGIGLDQLQSRASKVLYNYYEADTIQFTHVGIHGTVLAPYAHFDNPQGQANGTIIGKSWNGPMELHDVEFTGSLESVLDSVQ